MNVSFFKSLWAFLILSMHGFRLARHHSDNNIWYRFFFGGEILDRFPDIDELFDSNTGITSFTTVFNGSFKTLPIGKLVYYRLLTRFLVKSILNIKFTHRDSETAFLILWRYNKPTRSCINIVTNKAGGDCGILLPEVWKDFKDELSKEWRYRLRLPYK